MKRWSHAEPAIALHVNGLSFLIETWGGINGRPVLLLHGFPQEPATWAPVASALAADGCRVFAPCQRGYTPGTRPADPDGYTFGQFTADAIAVADALMLDEFDVAGFGLGGAQAWMLAAFHPRRVRSLVALRFPHPAAFAHCLQSDPEQREKWRRLEQEFGPADLADRAAMLLANDAAELRRFLATVGLPSQFIDSYVARLVRPGVLLGALSWEHAINVDEFCKVPSVSTPTLYVWSDGPALSRASVDATRNYVSGVYEEVFVDGVGNFILEHSPEAVIEPMRRHLSVT